MKYFKYLIAIAVLVISVQACKSQYELLLEGNDVDAKYAAAFSFFNQGKYNKSAQLFESLSALTSGTERDDTVQYYWGLSNYRFKDFYTAETNFTTFMANFPRSPFAESARYLRIDCLYRNTLRYELDQVPTNTAVAAIGEYLTEYPDTPYKEVCTIMLDDLADRLDKKAFESAKLYYTMEDYLASSVALKNVLKDDAENNYREDVLYYIAMSAYKYAELSIPEKQKERYLTFVDDYLNFIGEYPESGYRKELDGHYKRVQRLLGRYSTVLPDTDDADES